MIGLHLDYASPSVYLSQKERATLGLSAESKRDIRFKGKVKPESNFLLRTALRAMGDILWTDDRWWAEVPSMVLDPVVTIHRDKLFFEAFSFDQTAHAQLSVDNDLFEVDGETKCGSANIDFTAWLWGALGEMRSSRDTWLHIDTAGLELTSLGGGGRFERTLELPPTWLRGYLELQAAATLPGTRLALRPVDLLAVVRFLRYSKPKTSPRALRYEFEPGEPARIVLEPWEEAFVLHGTEHSYDTPKTTRLWGRSRLKLLEKLLPFADSTEVFLKGRGMPSFYSLKLPGIEFLLSLTGRSQQRFTSGGGLSLLDPESHVDETKLCAALEYLKSEQHISKKELSESLGVEKCQPLLREMCARGKAFYHPTSQRYRYRDLLPDEVILEEVFPVNDRVVKARDLSGSVNVEVCETRETRKIKRLATPSGKVLREIIFTDWHIEGKVGEQPHVQVVLNQEDRIIFGKCGCPLFRKNLLTEGPCEHMLALRSASEESRIDPATSVAVEEEDS
jgi:hypothetical protein